MRRGQRVRLIANHAMRGKLERLHGSHADVRWDDGRTTRVFASQLEAT